MKPEMLWERCDPDVELRSRFGFESTDEARAWASRVLSTQYGVTVSEVDRMVISAHNLMFWLRTDSSVRLLVKVCRLAAAHGWLSVRGAVVEWLAERELPVAAPVRSTDGDLQLLCDGRSIGLQPVLAGGLLDAGDLDQARAAGSTLARLHSELAVWPDAALLVDLEPVWLPPLVGWRMLGQGWWEEAAHWLR